MQLRRPPSLKKKSKLLFSGSYVEGAPGHDGFPFLFYQKFWDLIKFCRLNFVVLTLKPEELVASSMKKLRPISLLNCIFKIFTKVLTNTLALIMNIITIINQFAFIKGKYILESDDLS
jgi:hypothetical protein